ncbi:sugar ABC transporter substrate-binding protein [Georgenia sp. 10Sc9-8]|uniref:Sugar ABC transporter substrate-binding protein n=1 Tax=Georgenia halotolerans TaxID=3028317 RepID=A0ABT5U028_9MICO|nr:sugar ABC transporter substrate-binding protein [Georgenia halotolerans]
MSLRTRKVTAVLAGTALMMAGAAACSSERTTDGGGGDDAAADEGGGEGGGEAGGLIGIAMPTRSLERWNNDGANLEENLQEMGYETSLQYADNEVDQQITQIQNMLNQDPEVLVVAPIDGTALGPVLQSAADQGVEIIAYDRLINDTEAVDYYATFDNYQVGQLQGDFIVDELGLEDGEGPYNFEPFAGSPDDNNARFFFAGAWDVLLPYVEEGQLVVPSGKAPESVDGWTNIGIQGWSSETAQSEMQNRLNSFYAGEEQVDVVLSPNDSLALGIAQAFDAAGGYSPGENWPLITGQDADLANVNNMLAGMQAMTVWKDTRALGDQVATMVDQIVTGEEVDVNDTETYDNGVKVVPAYLLEPEVVTPETVEEKLVESGFYDADELNL